MIGKYPKLLQVAAAWYRSGFGLVNSVQPILPKGRIRRRAVRQQRYPAQQVGQVVGGREDDAVLEEREHRG